MKTPSIPSLLLLAGSLLAFTAAPAQAHLMNSGLGPFYDGLAHPLVTPEDLLCVIALSLLAGLHGPRFGRMFLLALPAAWLAGMVAAAFVTVAAPPVWLTCGLIVLAGLLVAVDRKLPMGVVLGLACLTGCVHGFANAVDAGQEPGGALAMGGILCTVFMLASLLGGQAAHVRAHWARVAARVAGSWVGAIGLLMLGWALRPT